MTFGFYGVLHKDSLKCFLEELNAFGLHIGVVTFTGEVAKSIKFLGHNCNN